jgi:hypothetical protein
MKREIAELMVSAPIDIEISGESQKIHPELALASTGAASKPQNNM